MGYDINSSLAPFYGIPQVLVTGFELRAIYRLLNGQETLDDKLSLEEMFCELKKESPNWLEKTNGFLSEKEL